MSVVFVSGCYDLLHGGHIEFLQAARALGERLVVCLPSERAVMAHRGRFPSLPLAQKIALFRELRCVDEVVVGDDEPLGLNFRSELLRIRPDILAAGEDDRYVGAKRRLCAEVGTRYVQIPKSRTWPDFSTTQLVQRMRTPLAVPLRVDLAGGWLDVPKLARPGAYVVNCAITPGVSLQQWRYEQCSGLGGSAAYRLLSQQDAGAAEADTQVSDFPAVRGSVWLMLVAWESFPGMKNVAAA